MKNSLAAFYIAERRGFILGMKINTLSILIHILYPLGIHWLFFRWSNNMITKAEVYKEDLNGKTFYNVCPNIKLGSYYKRTKNRIVCADKDEISEAVWDILHNKVFAQNVVMFFQVKAGMV
jgi:hypothetical protein